MEEFTNTHKSSPTNSSDFTNCCGCYVGKEQDKCPECEKTISYRQN